MSTESPKIKTLRLGPADVAVAARILREGGTVAIPTETVYGLAANALDPGSVEKIFIAKDRPHWDPLIVHICNAAMLDSIAQALPDRAHKLMAAFWPGPLTLVLERKTSVPDVVTAGRPLVGVRMPAQEIALQVLRLAGVPLAAPSANRFGHVSPTSAAHVLADLDGRIDAVLDAGPCDIGVESTVLDATVSPMILYRPGAVSAEEIERVAGPVRTFVPPVETQEPSAMPAPGVGIRHYAPRARLRLITDQMHLEAEIAANAGISLGVLLPPGWPAPDGVSICSWQALDDTDALAHTLFDRLRELDSRGVDVILVPLPNEQRVGLGAALMDRLQKAAKDR